jgi:hypothetical protein
MNLIDLNRLQVKCQFNYISSNDEFLTEKLVFNRGAHAISARFVEMNKEQKCARITKTLIWDRHTRK